jgi:hypothetical protein
VWVFSNFAGATEATSLGEHLLIVGRLLLDSRRGEKRNNDIVTCNVRTWPAME